MSCFAFLNGAAICLIFGVMKVRKMSERKYVSAILAGALVCSPAASAAASWFWKAVPPQISSEDGIGRAGAIAVVRDANRRGVGRFGSSAMAKRVAKQWLTEINQAARGAKVSEALLIALMMVESGGNPRAVSPAGARGLAQLMPGTARRYGVDDVFNPAQSLRGGAAYLSELLDMFDGDIVLALAAYNSGENAVLRFKGVPPYAETRAYVPRVLSAFLVASELCRRPPRHPRRRCVLGKQ